MLTNHVTSLELSRRLKEAGVKQESCFEWRKYSLNKEPLLVQVPEDGIELAILSGEIEWNASAFLSSELGEMLPNEHSYPMIIQDTNVKKRRIKLGIQNKTTSGQPIGDWIHVTVANTEQDARALLLLHLIEKGVIDVKTL